MASNNRIVSIVDDDMDINQLFHDALCKISGVSVFAFNDSIKALEHFTSKKEEYIIVLSDYRMPSFKGLDLLRKVKTLSPRVRTVLMSAYDVGGDDLLLKYMIEEIINTFIQKPVTIYHLCEEVNRQIHAYQLSSDRK